MKALFAFFLNFIGNFEDVGAPALGADSCPPAIACATLAVYTESKGQPMLGQVAVATVIKNRAKDPRYSIAICDVISERGQFDGIASFVPGTQPWRYDKVNWLKALIATEAVFDYNYEGGPCRDALYFYNPAISSANGIAFMRRKTEVCRYGNHVFLSD